MALTLSGTNGVVGAGFTLDASGASVTAGVGTFGSLNAPAAGLTGALPTISAASLTSIPAANIVGVCTSGLTKTGGFGGITQADEWRVTSYFDSQSGTITSNWERNDNNFSIVGDGMTESSGIFTFPETGIYKIEYHLAAYRSSGAFVRYAQGDIEITTDNSSYNNAARAYSSISNDATAYMSVTVSAIFDVTNTSTHKCKFDYAAESSLTWEGSSTMNRTHVTFIRLGDT